jgi:hypothetical protein
MLAMICGVVLALSFLGLPLAIIGLFIMSIVDQRSPRTGRRDKRSIATSPEIVVRSPHRSVKRPITTNRRDDIVVWRSLGVRRDTSAHVSGK